MDRTILINAGIIAAVRHSFLDGNRNALTARAQQLLFHCGDGVGIRAVNRFEVTGQLAYGIVQLCFRCRHVGRIQRQGIFLGVGFLRCYVGDRCRDGDLCRAACRQGDPAVTADERRIARVRDRVTRIRGRQGCFRTDDIVRRNCLVDSVNRSLGDVCLPNGVEIVALVILTAVVPVVTIVPLTLDGCFILILDWIIGTGRPAREIIALTGESTLAQLHILAEGRRLVGHCAVDGAFVGILDVEFDNILIIAPLGNQRDLIQTAKNGILVHGFAERTITVFDVPAIQRLVCGIRITGQIRQLAEHLVRFYRFVRNGALIAVAVKMYCDALCPMGIQRLAVFRVLGSKFILGGNFAAALGCIIPAVENIPGAHRGFQFRILRFSIWFNNIVIIVADRTSANNILCVTVIQICNNIDWQSPPRCFQRNNCTVFAG